MTAKIGAFPTTFVGRSFYWQDVEGLGKSFEEQWIGAFNNITMGGIYFLIENPLTSRLWLESSVQELMKLPGVYEVTCHAGAYGAVNSRGEMIRKGHRWLTNSEWLANQLQTKLTPEQQKQCVPLQGKETTLSQVYCPGSVKAILLGVRQTIQYHQRIASTAELIIPRLTILFLHLGRKTMFWQPLIRCGMLSSNWLDGLDWSECRFRHNQL